MAYQEIVYSTEGPIGYLTLNNPAKINALSRQMIKEITSALERVATDESIKVVVLNAAGKHFCAGHYMKEMVNTGVKENKDGGVDEVIGVELDYPKLQDQCDDGYRRMIVDSVIKPYFPSKIFNHMNDYIQIHFEKMSGKKV